MNDFFNLVAAMKSRQHLTVIAHNGVKVKGLVNGIRPESGSGKDWLVTMNTDTNRTHEFYVKTA